MGFSSFRDFQHLQSILYVPKRIGFPTKVTAGDINRLNARVHLAKSFKTIEVTNLGPDSTLGYEVFFRVFLTHSALERFLAVFGYKLQSLESSLAQFGAAELLATVQKFDKNRKLYSFLVERVNKDLAKQLAAFYDGSSSNFAHVSASIRHIFAHGHLSAQANGIRPKSIAAICNPLSHNLLRFMDVEFTNRIQAGMAKANHQRGSKP